MFAVISFRLRTICGAVPEPAMLLCECGRIVRFQEDRTTQPDGLTSGRKASRKQCDRRAGKERAPGDEGCHAFKCMPTNVRAGTRRYAGRDGTESRDQLLWRREDCRLRAGCTQRGID